MRKKLLVCIGVLVFVPFFPLFAQDNGIARRGGHEGKGQADGGWRIRQRRVGKRDRRPLRQRRLRRVKARAGDSMTISIYQLNYGGMKWEQ